jgi:hypothetical protein
MQDVITGNGNFCTGEKENGPQRREDRRVRRSEELALPGRKSEWVGHQR